MWGQDPGFLRKPNRFKMFAVRVGKPPADPNKRPANDRFRPKADISCPPPMWLIRTQIVSFEPIKAQQKCGAECGSESCCRKEIHVI
jgi:hypothetical protein